MKKVIFIIIILLFLVFLYGHYIEVNNFKVNEYVIDLDVPESFKELKIIHLSDIHYESGQKNLAKVSKKINELDADIVFFTGDLFKTNENYTEEDYEYLQDFLTNIEANYYKYAVIGDTDEIRLEKYKDLLYKADFKLLDNESTLFFYKDNTPINIIGLSDNFNLEELLTSDVTYDNAIVLTHKPDTIQNINNEKVKAIFSGHSLGGVINMPFYGGLIKKDGAQTYVDKYYFVNNTYLYINNGIGNENFNFRLFNTPSINVYRFK